jgi:hypothetical protein
VLLRCFPRAYFSLYYINPQTGIHLPITIPKGCAIVKRKTWFVCLVLLSCFALPASAQVVVEVPDRIDSISESNGCMPSSYNPLTKTCKKKVYQCIAATEVVCNEREIISQCNIPNRMTYPCNPQVQVCAQYSARHAPDPVCDPYHPSYNPQFCQQNYGHAGRQGSGHPNRRGRHGNGRFNPNQPYQPPPPMCYYHEKTCGFPPPQCGDVIVTVDANTGLPVNERTVNAAPAPNGNAGGTGVSCGLLKSGECEDYQRKFGGSNPSPMTSSDAGTPKDASQAPPPAPPPPAH